MDTRHAIVRIVSATPTLDTNAYGSGDLVGTKMTFDLSAFRAAGGNVVLESVLIRDLAKQSANLDLVLFSSDPTASTLTDNAAFDPHDTDLAAVVAVIPITTHNAYNDNGISYARNLAIPLNLDVTDASLNLYGVLVARATPTYAASDLRVNLTVRTL